MVSFDLKKLFRVPNPEQRLAGLGLRPDLLRAACAMASDERSDIEMKPIEHLLNDSETVVRIVEGIRTKQMGFLVLTTENIVFRWHGAAAGVGDRIPLSAVSDVQDRAKGMTGRVRVNWTGPLLEVDKILGIQAAQFAQDLRGQLLSPGIAPADPVQELLELRERRAAGKIDEADYRAAKARLLDEL
jgi:hypothetical protein